ncbi:MAG: hypothetical protein JWQ33_662 [Ramlibacter sp.]|nr:hypothetical protein [Ramlibacter sp.]
MTASKQIKGMLAGVAAVAFIGTAMAQGNPPNPAIKSAPVGAGQQSSQQTPMGTTGTPTGSGTTGSSATSNSGTGASSNTGAASTSGGTSMGSSSASTDSTVASSTGGTRSKRRMRADRN